MTTQILTIETYKDTGISFRGDAWVNATQMAKPFGKRPNDFKDLPSTKKFMQALASDLESLPENLVVVQIGGTTPGTWMHPDLALEFARWLSPEFAIWTNRVIRRLMAGQPVPSTGDLSKVVTSLENISSNLDNLSRRIGEQDLRINRLATHISWVENLHAIQNVKKSPHMKVTLYMDPFFQMPLIKASHEYYTAFQKLGTARVKKILVENGWLDEITGQLNPWAIEKGYAEYCEPTPRHGYIAISQRGAEYLKRALSFHWGEKLSGKGAS